MVVATTLLATTLLVALSVVDVMMLAPEMFPPDPLVVILLAVTLPVADTDPLVLMLPLTLKLAKVPIEVATTPVSCDPLPIK